MKATVVLSTGAEASGYGSETLDDWKDYIEKAETKAIGRALAALGLGTQFCSDFEFGEPEKVVDAPVPFRREPKATAPPRPPMPEAEAVGSKGGWQDRPATEPQVKAIYAIARGMHGMDQADVDSLCRQRYGCLPGELSRNNASNLIDAIKLTTKKEEPDILQADVLPDGDEPLSQSGLALGVPAQSTNRRSSH